MQQKKIPLRKCMGCGEIVLDLTGRKNGRGAYICRDVECLKKARKAKRIEKSFLCQIPDEVYDKMAEELKNDE